MKLKEKHPEVAREWNTEKNKPLDLDGISHGSRRKVWWTCGKCGRDFHMRVDNRTGMGCGCPVCKRGKKLEPLLKTHPDLVKEWHPKNTSKPDKITAGTHQRVWWRGSCGHEWLAHVHNRTRLSRPAGCPFCNNRLVDSTNSLRSKNPDVAKEWHPTKNDELTPDNVNYRSYKSVWWLGKCEHEWQTLVRTRTRKVRPAGCPVCRDSKGEQRVEEVLKDLGISFRKQARFQDCRAKYPLPFDFKIENQKMLIEYQGLQHYEPVNFGGDYIKIFTDLQEHDKIKKEWCGRHGYKLIAIPYHRFDEIQEILEGEV